MRTRSLLKFLWFLFSRQLDYLWNPRNITPCETDFLLYGISVWCLDLQIWCWHTVRHVCRVNISAREYMYSSKPHSHSKRMGRSGIYPTKSVYIRKSNSSCMLVLQLCCAMVGTGVTAHSRYQISTWFIKTVWPQAYMNNPVGYSLGGSSDQILCSTPAILQPQWHV